MRTDKQIIQSLELDMWATMHEEYTKDPQSIMDHIAAVKSGINDQYNDRMRSECIEDWS
jgi:hypothetical protein